MKKLYVTTSWDDGHKLDLRLADLLGKYNLSGTFYVSPYNREFKKTDLLTQRDVKNISETHDIGAHTLHHLNLRRLSLNEAENEVVGSKSFLENILQKEIFMFCYPMGSYNPDIIKIVKEAGFIGSRTTERFITSLKDRYETGTNLQVYTHFSDALKVLSFYNFDLVKTFRNFSWKDVAKNYFDYLQKNGGIFHIWGHSWEIEKNHDWKKLEDVFEYISHKKEVVYLSNSDLVKGAL